MIYLCLGFKKRGGYAHYMSLNMFIASKGLKSISQCVQKKPNMAESCTSAMFGFLMLNLCFIGHICRCCNVHSLMLNLHFGRA